MLLLLAFLVVLLVFGLGFALPVLWILAAIFLILWVVCGWSATPSVAASAQGASTSIAGSCTNAIPPPAGAPAGGWWRRGARDNGVWI